MIFAQAWCLSLCIFLTSYLRYTMTSLCVSAVCWEPLKSWIPCVCKRTSKADSDSETMKKLHLNFYFNIFLKLELKWGCVNLLARLTLTLQILYKNYPEYKKKSSKRASFADYAGAIILSNRFMLQSYWKNENRNKQKPIKNKFLIEFSGQRQSTAKQNLIRTRQRQPLWHWSKNVSNFIL